MLFRSMVPIVTILVALGLVSAYQYSKKLNIKYLLYLLFVLLAGFNFVYYINQYFVQQNYFLSSDWQYGYKQAVDKTKTLSDNYEKIVVSNKGYLDQSYIFYLFYLKYPPKEYQSQMSFLQNSQTDRKISKYEFRPINWKIDKEIKNVLYVGMPEEFPDDYPKKAEIHFLDGKPALEIVGT